MASTVAARTPAHLWIVGALALLWNAFGSYDYVMTQAGDAAYLSQYPAEQIAYFESLPAWLTAFWAIGVWGGLAGAILLLARRRLAVHAFAASVLGIVVSFGYELAFTSMPASMKEAPMVYMPWVILIVALAQLWSARKMAREQLLR